MIIINILRHKIFFQLRVSQIHRTGSSVSTVQYVGPKFGFRLGFQTRALTKRSPRVCDDVQPWGTFRSFFVVLLLLLLFFCLFLF